MPVTKRKSELEGKDRDYLNDDYEEPGFDKEWHYVGSIGFELLMEFVLTFIYALISLFVFSYAISTSFPLRYELENMAIISLGTGLAMYFVQSIGLPFMVGHLSPFVTLVFLLKLLVYKTEDKKWPRALMFIGFIALQCLAYFLAALFVWFIDGSCKPSFGKSFISYRFSLLRGFLIAVFQTAVYYLVYFMATHTIRVGPDAADDASPNPKRKIQYYKAKWNSSPSLLIAITTCVVIAALGPMVGDATMPQRNIMAGLVEYWSCFASSDACHYCRGSTTIDYINTLNLTYNASKEYLVTNYTVAKGFSGKCNYPTADTTFEETTNSSIALLNTAKCKLGQYDWWIYLVAPLVGALIALLLHMIIILTSGQAKEYGDRFSMSNNNLETSGANPMAYQSFSKAASEMFGLQKSS